MRFSTDGETRFSDGGIEPLVNSHEEAFVGRIIDSNRRQVTGRMAVQEAFRAEEATLPPVHTINLDYLAATGISKPA